MVPAAFVPVSGNLGFFFPESRIILLESDSSFYSHTKMNEIGTLISWVGMGKEEDSD